MGDLLGTIEPGKIADLLVIKGDPTVDLKALRAVRYVMADGRFVLENPER
jgi:imidazolonepropionase-like amidohydrolase